MRKGCGLSSRRAIRRAAFGALESLEGRRLLSAGGLDPSFGTGGKVTTTFTGPSNDGATVVITEVNTGYLVVAGDSSNGATIVRYLSPGVRDGDFGNDSNPANDGAAFIDPSKMIIARSIVQD